MSTHSGPRSEYYDGSSSAKPARSASALAKAGISENGAYWYQFADGTVAQLWTDFTSFTNFNFVLVTRLSTADQNQYYTTANNIGDLIVADTTAPSRSSKISDTNMNQIIKENGVRWAIVGPKTTFYLMNDNWTSNLGSSQTCSYTNSYYKAYATPSNIPNWQYNFLRYQGACGGGQDASGNWLSLTGIHVGDGVYMGGYTGASPYRGDCPKNYLCNSNGDGSWTTPGYVFLAW